jgi:hypothetical protein
MHERAPTLSPLPLSLLYLSTNHSLILSHHIASNPTHRHYSSTKVLISAPSPRESATPSDPCEPLTSGCQAILGAPVRWPFRTPSLFSPKPSHLSTLITLERDHALPISPEASYRRLNQHGQNRFSFPSDSLFEFERSKLVSRFSFHRRRRTPAGV